MPRGSCCFVQIERFFPFRFFAFSFTGGLEPNLHMLALRMPQRGQRHAVVGLWPRSVVNTDSFAVGSLLQNHSLDLMSIDDLDLLSDNSLDLLSLGGLDLLSPSGLCGRERIERHAPACRNGDLSRSIVSDCARGGGPYIPSAYRCACLGIIHRYCGALITRTQNIAAACYKQRSVHPLGLLGPVNRTVERLALDVET